MADLQTRWRHGIRAMCAMVGGVAVARYTDLMEPDALADWLDANPERLMDLWDAMEDEEAHGCAGVTERTLLGAADDA